MTLSPTETARGAGRSITSNFGLALKQRLDEFGIENDLYYPGASTKYRSVADFFQAEVQVEIAPLRGRLPRCCRSGRGALRCGRRPALRADGTRFRGYNARVLQAAIFVVLLAAPLAADEWRHYGNDPGGMRYSPLDQISRSNVQRLEVAWEHDSPDFADGRSGSPTRSAFEATPLMIGRTLYIPTPLDRLLALDAASGHLQWEFNPELNEDSASTSS